jgi:hypothetical protein
VSLFIVILNTIILGVIMLNVIMQRVMAPFTLFPKMSHLCHFFCSIMSVRLSSTVKCDKIYSNERINLVILTAVAIGELLSSKHSLTNNRGEAFSPYFYSDLLESHFMFFINLMVN